MIMPVLLTVKLLVNVPVEVTFMVPVTLFVRLPLLMIDPSTVIATLASVTRVVAKGIKSVSPLDTVCPVVDTVHVDVALTQTPPRAAAQVIESIVVVDANASFTENGDSTPSAPTNKITANSVIPRIEVLLPMPNFL